MALMKLSIEPEFRDLLPPLSAEEYSALEESILTEGCREAIVTWGSIIVDGHHRYSICSAHSLSFTTVPFYGGPDFDYLPSMSAKREAVKRWIINTQLARRNLTDEQRAHYFGILFDSGKGDPVDNLIPGGGGGSDAAASEKPHLERIDSKSQNETSRNPPEKSGDTATRIAKEHGVSRNTIIRAGQFHKGVEEIGKIDPAVREKILSGAARPFVKMGDVQAVGRAPEKAIEIVKAIINKEPLPKPAPVAPPKPATSTATTTLAAAVPAATSPSAMPCGVGEASGSHSVHGAAAGGGDHLTVGYGLDDITHVAVVTTIDRILTNIKLESLSDEELEDYYGDIERLKDIVEEHHQNLVTATTGRGIYILPTAPNPKEVHAADLVPPDVERPEAVSWYADDFLAGVADMTNEQAGAYARLLSLQQSKGPLTKEQMLSITSDKFVHKKFQLCDDGTYINPRMEKEVKARLAHQAAQRERINKRWNKNGNGNGGAAGTGDGYRGNTAVLPVLKDLKDKTNQDKQKDVYPDVPPLNNNGVNVLSLGVKDKKAGITDSAGAGADDIDQTPPKEEFDQRTETDDAMFTAPKATKEVRRQRGPDGWVKLTDSEYGKLVDKFGEQKITEYIKRVDRYCAGNGNAKKYKSYYHVILNWIERDGSGQTYGKPFNAGRTEYEFVRKARESGKYDNL